MKITRIETVITRPPIRHSGMLGVGALENVDSVIVRLRTDEGVEGVGESSPWPVFAGNAFSIKETIDRYLAPAVIGRSVTDIEAILMAMDAVHYAANFAKAGVEMAVLDAAGKSLGLPVYDLLGGLVRGSRSFLSDCLGWFFLLALRRFVSRLPGSSRGRTRKGKVKG